MKKPSILLAIVISVFIALGSFIALRLAPRFSPLENFIADNPQTSTNSNTKEKEINLKCANIYTLDDGFVELDNFDSTITSPLNLKGKISGSWCFENTCHVSLVDQNGKTLVQETFSLDDSWTTNNLVSFETSLDFTKPKTNTGLLVFEKDNPSGLAENCAKTKIPVTF